MFFSGRTTMLSRAAARALSKKATIAPHVAAVDPAVADLIDREAHRQRRGIELIASENFTSPAVLEALGSVFTNKYSEGYPGKRYYGGNAVVDDLERLCQSRALEVFGATGGDWGVNVQPLSGSPANFATYTALLQPHDRIMGLDLPDGGHLTHGFMTNKARVSATSVYFESMPYKVRADTGLIDYDALEEHAKLFRPKLIICGGSAYPRTLDFARFRRIADSVGALLHCDMAHISGLVAAKLHPSPFEHCDVITSTTHKTLRGPRSGLIFARSDLMPAVNAAVFPSLQGGPHNHQIAALAVALHEAAQPSFADYQRRVLDNAHALAESLSARGLKLATGGTETHLVLLDATSLPGGGADGARCERVLELAGVTVNKNSIPGDTKPLTPSGLRVGAPAMTTRGAGAGDFVEIAGILADGIAEAAEVQRRAGGGLRVFREEADRDATGGIARVRERAEAIARKFPHPSLQDWD